MGRALSGAEGALVGIAVCSPPDIPACTCVLSRPRQILWTFSIYLESVAILPQLFMVSKTGEAETITSHYLFALGVYRTLYLFNWIWRYYFEGFFDLIAIVAGLVQTVLYCDFFYLYITKGSQWGGSWGGAGWGGGRWEGPAPSPALALRHPSPVWGRGGVTFSHRGASCWDHVETRWAPLPSPGAFWEEETGQREGQGGL